MPPMMPPRPPGAGQPPMMPPGGGMPPGAGGPPQLPAPPEAPAIPSPEERAAQVSDQDLQMLAAAPDTVDTIARLFPEIADELMTLMQQADQDDEGGMEGEGETQGPSYSVPRPTSRLGQM